MDPKLEGSGAVTDEENELSLAQKGLQFFIKTDVRTARSECKYSMLGNLE